MYCLVLQSLKLLRTCNKVLSALCCLFLRWRHGYSVVNASPVADFMQVVAQLKAMVEQLPEATEEDEEHQRQLQVRSTSFGRSSWQRMCVCLCRDAFLCGKPRRTRSTSGSCRQGLVWLLWMAHAV